MKKLETRTVNGIEIEPVYALVWHGTYSTGEWNEEVFQHFTDRGVRELEAERTKIIPLPPLPWEATPEDLATFEERKELKRSYDRAIEYRRSALAELFYNG